MYKNLRIICCIISAILVAGCVFAFVFLGSAWGVVTIVGAGTFFALTVLFKKMQEDKESERSAKSKGDFISGPADSTASQAPDATNADMHTPTDENK